VTGQSGVVNRKSIFYRLGSLRHLTRIMEEAVAPKSA
jgi:hypothetical protein